MADDLSRAVALYNSKQFAAALPLLHAAALSQDGLPSSTETADILHKIGECYSEQVNYRAASGYCRRAAAFNSYGIEGRARASLSAANAFYNLDEYAAAETQIDALFSMLGAEAAVGRNAPASLRGIRVKALLLSADNLLARGRFSESLPIYEKALLHYESVYDTQNLIDCLTGLGEVYFAQGLSDKAQATALRAQSLNPGTVTSLDHLSSLLSLLNRHQEALACATKALAYEEVERGRNTGNYAAIQARIGTEYSFLGQSETALSWLQRARAGCEEHNLTTTRNFGLLLNNLGVASLKTRRFSEALAHFTRAETVYRGVLPPDHPDIAGCMLNITTANYKLGNFDAAAVAAAAVDATARRSQVQCAATGCPRKLKADGTSLDQCGGCERCYYCSKACQTADWKAGHKAECKALQKL